MYSTVTRPVAMGWQMPPLNNRVPVFCHPREFFSHFSCYCIIVVAKEKSPEITDELSLGLCDVLESSIFS